jgi:hypothetical protein
VRTTANSPASEGEPTGPPAAALEDRIPHDAGRPEEDTVPRWLRIVLIVLVIAITIVVLFTTVFPWVEQRLEDPTMGVAQVVRSPR